MDPRYYIFNMYAKDEIFQPIFLTKSIVPEIATVKICEAIDVTKASAVSNISTEILKHSFLALILQLTFLINKSFRDEEFPAKWKMATITPLQKVGIHLM